MTRLTPICSKDGITNFYSSCRAGCTGKSEFRPRLDPYASPEELEKASQPITVYDDCSCAEAAWRETNSSLSDQWIKNDHMYGWDHPDDVSVQMARDKVAGDPITQATEGWCDVDCGDIFRTFMITMFVLSVFGSMGRIGNVLVALRCISVEDKSLSMAFNVVFMSLFAMLPAPMVYGAIIDNTCILWQEECGETTNCIIYSLDRLRLALMITTAAIMFGGVLLDIGVWYYAKDLVIFYDEGKADGKKEAAAVDATDVDVEEEKEAALEKKFVSTMSLNGGPVFNHVS